MNTLVNLVIFKSDDGKTWEAVPPDQVPAWVMEDETVYRLSHGETAQAPGELTCYAALKQDFNLEQLGKH